KLLAQAEHQRLRLLSSPPVAIVTPFHCRSYFMKLTAVGCLVLLAIGAVSKSEEPEIPAASNAEDAKLAAFFKSYLDAEFRRHPSSATRSGDHRYDDRLDDLSPAAQAADLKAMRDALADLPRQVDYKKLTRAGQIDFEILKHALEYGLWKAEN